MLSPRLTARSSVPERVGGHERPNGCFKTFNHVTATANGGLRLLQILAMGDCNEAVRNHETCCRCRPCACGAKVSGLIQAPVTVHLIDWIESVAFQETGCCRQSHGSVTGPLSRLKPERSVANWIRDRWERLLRLEFNACAWAASLSRSQQTSAKPVQSCTRMMTTHCFRRMGVHDAAGGVACSTAWAQPGRKCGQKTETSLPEPQDRSVRMSAGFYNGRT